MVSEATQAWVGRHAGLVDGEPSVTAASDHELRAALDDYVAALACLNRELNGPMPEAIDADPASVPRAVAYAAAEVSRMLREHPGRADAAWEAEMAWLAVLAGDIDDLPTHLAEERAART